MKQISILHSYVLNNYLKICKLLEVPSPSYTLLGERLRTLKINKELTADSNKSQKIIQLRTNLRSTLLLHLFGC
jgi:hypothetical protein